MNRKYLPTTANSGITTCGALALCCALVAQTARAALPPPPPLPTFGPAVYNVTDSNPSINGGVAASAASADNAAALNAYITYCSTSGGGTVEIPAGTFLSGTITMRSNVRSENRQRRHPPRHQHQQ